MSPVRILGGGPAGCCAALAALASGRPAEITERSLRPRHKVCGEFFSPEIEPVLAPLGVWDRFQMAGPARIRRIRLCFGNRSRTAALPDGAWGLSRLRYDQLLRDAAIERGAALVETADAAPFDIVATGRSHDNAPQRGERLFGWKAHYRGPADDAVELYFFRDCYVGINAVENGITNVCGLAPESMLRRHGFDPDAMIHGLAPLRERVNGLERCWHWIHTGPLVLQHSLRGGGESLPAGDALSFVDPFTGSGLLAAALTGTLSGRSAAAGRSREDYLRACRQMLQAPFVAASALRRLAGTELAGYVSSLISPALLFRWTRPCLK